MGNYNYELEKQLGLTPELPKSLQNIADDAILTPEDLANYMGLSIRQARRYCEQGKIRALCFGRKYVIYGSDFKAFLRDNIIRPESVKRMLS
jgi:excisionase family DNA binding protein